MLHSNVNVTPPYTTMNPPSSRPTSLLLQTTAASSAPSFSFPGLTPSNENSALVFTPNTLKSIEESILQNLGEDAEQYNVIESTQYSGNFVPPLPSTSTITLINTWQGGQVCSNDQDEKPEPTQPPAPVSPVLKKSPRARKPKQTPEPKRGKKSSVSPSSTNKSSGSPPVSEEEERRKVRRERNKLAAARCRKRRVDHTNKLVEETEGLEAKKRALQKQITELQSQKEELEFVLEAHNCVRKIKSEVLSDIQNHQSRPQGEKLKRPTSLPVHDRVMIPVTSSINTPVPPMPIQTPSNGIELGFETLDWAVTPADDDKIVPDKNPATLVTPVNPNYKKLHNL